MKGGCGQEEDLSELLQFADDEAAGPSNVADNHWEPELEPKHTIFLSHSGAQKNFTEQLCVDLESWDYSPFFDKRPDSLPKGRKFPELIFRAAKQCHVAILVLSEDFFTRTKWPMLELEAFVQSQEDNLGKLSILPVYLGLSRDECTGNETRRQRWLSVWRDWAQKEDRIDVGKWENALKVLGPSNGIEYVESLGEVGLRKQIVSAVRGLIPLESSWSGGHVQGRTRIVKAIIEKLATTKPSSYYVRVLGIYGMGGIGKTTFCKALCDVLHEKFAGRVCHAELGTKSEPIELHKEVLRRLTDVNHDSLMSKTEAMTMDLLRQHIQRQQVFLALDNVWQDSLEQAKDYLSVKFHRRSIVMVMARSIDILQRLKINKCDCLEMPDLEEEEAKQLFLQHATPQLHSISEGDEPKIQYCIRQCQFCKGANRGEHFHPLALKVLGAQLGSLGCDPSLWVKNLSKDDKFNHFREKVHPIFNILRKGYDSLHEEDQLLFMDAILFHPSQRQSYYCGDAFVSGNIIERQSFCLDIYNWLSIVHDMLEVRFIKDRLQALKAKSLIEDIGDGFHGVIVHDLYLEFAKHEVKRGALNGRRWVWYDKEATYPADLARRPSGNCWSNVERISVKFLDDPFDKSIRWLGTLEGMKWQQFSNVVVLQLLIGRNEVLDLRGLQCLKTIELRWDNLFRGGSKSGGQLIGLGELRNLAWLDLGNIHFGPCFQEIGQLTRLKVLRLETNCFGESPCSEPLEAPNLDKCIQLQELVLQCTCLTSFPDLRKLTSLRKILFRGFETAKEVVGLSSQMTSLQELWLLRCDSLSRCSGLGDVVSLQQLDVEGCHLSQIPDLHKLTKLRRLYIRWNNVKKLLGLNECIQLQELCVWGIDELPNLDLLKHLQRLMIARFESTVMPRFDSFIALEELILHSLREVRDIHGMRSLTRLKRLTISSAPNLLELPELGALVALQYLSLSNCCSLVGKLELPNLHKLINLEVLDITSTPIRRLPSLERLTQLRELTCSETLLAELPVLNGLDKLECIDLRECRELTSLEKVGTLPALIRLDVSICYRLTRLPDFRSSRSLEYLCFCYTEVRLGSEDMRALATLPALHMWGWDHVGVPFSVLLEKMSLMEVVLHLEAKQLEYFTTLQTRTDPEKWQLYGLTSHACSHGYSSLGTSFGLSILKG